MNIFEQQAMQIAKVKELTSERTLSGKTVAANAPDDVDFDPPTPEPEYWWERAERDSGMKASDFK